MRLIVLGNGPYAVPSLRALSASGHEVLAVVVRPPPTGRGHHRHPKSGPMQQAAEALGIRVHAPPTVNNEQTLAALAAARPDLLVVCDYGEILQAGTLGMAPLGAINLHGSLLPKYRGAAPVAWAILRGESQTGNTVIQMTPGLDAGPILGQSSLAIDADETAGELEARLAEQGASLCVDVIHALEAGSAQPIDQDKSLATKAPRLRKSDGAVDWSRSAVEIKNHVRAMQPWPRAYTNWHREKRDALRLIVRRVQIAATSSFEAGSFGRREPGSVLCADGRLLVAAGDGAIEITELQPAGKRAMKAQDFIRGRSELVGQRFEI